MEELERKIILLLSDNKPRIQNDIIDGIGMDHKLNAVRNMISRIFNKSSFLKIVRRASNENIQGKAWTLKDTAFDILVIEFIGTPDTEKFFNSTYCQNMINSELVEKLKTEWDYPKNIEIENGFMVIPMYNSIGEKTHDINIEFSENSVFTDEKVIELLRFSPSALRTLISTEYKMDRFIGQRVRPISNPPVKADEKLESSRFDEILIFNVILDLKKYRRREGIEIYLETEMKIKLQLIKKGECLFNWDMITGNDSVKLIGFLRQNYGIDWVTTAKIEMINNGKTIMITNNKNFLSLSLNDENNDVMLQIDDGRTDKFIVEYENNKLNIYKDTGKKDILGKTEDMVKIQPANKIKSKELTCEELLKKIIELRENDTENFTLLGAGYY